MRSFAARSHESEWMDGDSDYETFKACLADLEGINHLTLAYRPTLSFLERIRREGLWPEGRPLTILDAGSGHGDMLRQIDGWAARRGLKVDLVGVDLNPFSARSAEAATPAGRPIRYLTTDLFAYDPPDGVDLVISSLFTHHLDDGEVVRFLRFMEKRAALGWFVNDLRRQWFPFYGFGLATWLLRRHPYVRHDGPVSIARAFVPADWGRALAKAGIEGAEVRRWFPFRLCVARVRSN